MLWNRYETDKFFEYISEHTIHMDPILAQIDELLEGEELYQLIRSDFAIRYPKLESRTYRILVGPHSVKKYYWRRRSNSKSGTFLPPNLIEGSSIMNLFIWNSLSISVNDF